jgi:hypothetical protein
MYYVAIPPQRKDYCEHLVLGECEIKNLWAERNKKPRGPKAPGSKEFKTDRTANFSIPRHAGGY